jgi:hypothetical protein
VQFFCSNISWLLVTPVQTLFFCLAICMAVEDDHILVQICIDQGSSIKMIFRTVVSKMTPDDTRLAGVSVSNSVTCQSSVTCHCPCGSRNCNFCDSHWQTPLKNLREWLPLQRVVRSDFHKGSMFLLETWKQATTLRNSIIQFNWIRIRLWSYDVYDIQAHALGNIGIWWHLRHWKIISICQRLHKLT